MFEHLPLRIQLSAPGAGPGSTQAPGTTFWYPAHTHSSGTLLGFGLMYLFLHRQLEPATPLCTAEIGQGTWFGQPQDLTIERAERPEDAQIHSHFGLEGHQATLQSNRFSLLHMASFLLGYKPYPPPRAIIWRCQKDSARQLWLRVKTEALPERQAQGTWKQAHALSCDNKLPGILSALCALGRWVSCQPLEKERCTRCDHPPWMPFK